MGKTVHYKECQRNIVGDCAIIPALIVLVLNRRKAGFGDPPMKRSLLTSLLLLACCAVFSPVAFADSPREHTQFGRDITIGTGEEASDVTCFGCSVRVRGRVLGDVTVFAGRVTIEEQGQVNGDTTVFGAGIRLDKQARVAGDVTVFGGELRRDSAASIGGDVTNFSGPAWLVLIFGLPLVILGAFIALIVWMIRRLTRPGVPATA
jgi:hypothetical protein